METVSKNGCRFRTKLLTEERAKRFAACIRRNSRFQDVQVEESQRSKNWYQRHYVSYVPANEERQREMLDRQQDARQRRADTEGRSYVFVWDPDSIQPFAWCLAISGEVYEVTTFDCTCPDFRFRCQGVGICCKHMLALRQAIERGDVRIW